MALFLGLTFWRWLGHPPWRALVERSSRSVSSRRMVLCALCLIFYELSILLILWFFITGGALDRGFSILDSSLRWGAHCLLMIVLMGLLLRIPPLHFSMVDRIVLPLAAICIVWILGIGYGLHIFSTQHSNLFQFSWLHLFYYIPTTFYLFSCLILVTRGAGGLDRHLRTLLVGISAVFCISSILPLIPFLIRNIDSQDVFSAFYIVGDVAFVAVLPLVFFLSRRIRALGMWPIQMSLCEPAFSLKKEASQLQSALDQQAQFTSDASHELKTPLSVLLNELDWILENPELGIGERESLAICKIAGQHMCGLIDNLLELARLDSDEDYLEYENLSIQALVRETVLMIKPRAVDKGVDIELSLPMQDVRIDGDRTRIRQVLMNLLSNSLKYSEGNIFCRLQSNGQTLRIEVEDSGGGIDPSDLPFIFDRFYRSDRARLNSEMFGSGLGLTVSRSIAVAHGGDLYVERSDDSGTLFIFELPMTFAFQAVQGPRRDGSIRNVGYPGAVATSFRLTQKIP